MSIIYKQLLLKLQNLEKEIENINKQLESLPEGSISCAINGPNYKWYHLKKNGADYIPKKNRALAEQLAHKKYLLTLSEDLSKEKRAIQYYLKHSPRSSNTTKLLHHPEYQRLLSITFRPQNEELADWMHTPYERSTNHPEHLIHKSSSGNLVRSKSEAIIDMLLYLHKIPFRYECALHLGSTTLFPDFTIKHPLTGKIYYWEHLGLLDNSSYANNTISKLQLYTSHGILPSFNLITTAETKEVPLSADTVAKIIRLYFES